MYSGGQSSSTQTAYRKKVVLSYEIRNDIEKYHRNGVNSLQVDPIRGRLYTGGRDAVIRVWSSQTGQWIANLDHHQNWVSEIVLCCNNRNLLSCSNDTTVKVWNAHKGFCMSTLRTHKDYVHCLAYAHHRELVASAGLDCSIFLWDVQALTALTLANSTITTTSITNNKNSIYSLAINPSGSLLVSGSTEKVVRIWDTRTCSKIMKLKGHTDNIRALLISRDGSQVISASSDSTIRIWNLGQQRCVSTIRCHDEGVWSLAANESFTTIYSAGKDMNVMATQLNNIDNQWLVCRETHPVLKVLYDGETQDRESLWVSTTNSSVKRWPLNLSSNSNGMNDGWIGEGDGIGRLSQPPEYSDNRDADPAYLNPNMTCHPSNEPDLVITGNPSVRSYRVLNDKRYIMTKDSENNVDIYDVLTATKTESLGSSVDFNEELEKRFKMIYVPNWFTVDLKTGMLAIQLEEPECFSAWVSAKEYGFVDAKDSIDPKINLGGLLLQALLESWPQSELEHQSDSEHADGSSPSPHDPGRPANHYFSVPPHTPLMLSEIGNGNQRTLLRLLVGDAKRDAENDLLLEAIPSWVSDVVVSRNMPKFNKIPFFLLPHPSSGIKPLRKERLSASDMLQARKVMEHVYEKMLQDQSTANEHGADGSSESTDKVPAGGSSSNALMDATGAEQKIQLLCQDQVIDANMDLRTVKHFVWKSGTDLVLHYRLIDSQ